MYSLVEHCKTPDSILCLYLFIHYFTHSLLQLFTKYLDILLCDDLVIYCCITDHPKVGVKMTNLYFIFLAKDFGGAHGNGFVPYVPVTCTDLVCGLLWRANDS